LTSLYRAGYAAHCRGTPWEQS